MKRKCLNSEEPINLKIDHDYENRERDEWELDYLQLAVEAVLGEGAFGVVKKGILLKSEYDEKTDVAIKMLKGNFSTILVNGYYLLKFIKSCLEFIITTSQFINSSIIVYFST